LEPDAKLRITSDYTPDGVMTTVEIRRGVGEVLTITITGPELLRVVHDSVYLADDRYRLTHASGPDDPGNVGG
jgi:hypothetical protein